MAAPTYRNSSTGTTDATGAWSHTSAAPEAAGRVLIVHVLQDGTSTGANQPNITSVTNAENLAGTDNVLTKIGVYNVGGTPQAYQHLWIGRSLSTSAMVITGTNVGGDDVYVRVHEFNNVNTGTTLADVLENGSAGTVNSAAATSGTVADVGVTTLGPDRLALQFIAINDDNTLSPALSGASGGTWSLSVGAYLDAGGTDGALYLYHASMASAGTIDGATAGNPDATDGWGVVGFALIGTTVDGLNPNFSHRVYSQAVNRASTI